MLGISRRRSTTLRSPSSPALAPQFLYNAIGENNAASSMHTSSAPDFSYNAVGETPPSQHTAVLPYFIRLIFGIGDSGNLTDDKRAMVLHNKALEKFMKQIAKDNKFATSKIHLSEGSSLSSRKSKTRVVKNINWFIKPWCVLCGK